MSTRRIVTVLLALGLLLSLGSGAHAAPKGKPPLYPLDTNRAAASDSVVLKWDEAMLRCVRGSPPRPTVVARQLAIVSTAMYDAWTAYDAVADPVVTTDWQRQPVLERTDENKDKAISFAAYRAIRSLWPAFNTETDQLMTSLGYATDGSDTSTAAAVGTRAANAVLASRLNDGSNQAGNYANTSGYEPVNTADVITDPLRWQPLRLPSGTVQTPLTPHWGSVRPFALPSGWRTLEGRFVPVGPVVTRNRSTYTRAVAEVVEIGATLTDAAKVQAEYWADGPDSESPPGHWNLFAQWVSRERRYSLDDDVRLFFALNNAMLDASIVAWDAKYRYDPKHRWDFVRPVTAVRLQYAGQRIRGWAGPTEGITEIDGEDWLPYQRSDFVTPAFPEYVSGHSTFSAAGATVLRSFGIDITGMKYKDAERFGASTTIEAGSAIIESGVPATDITLSWPTFSAAVDEAGYSRLQGGIHFQDANLHGQTLGANVGDAAWARSVSLFEGTVR